MRTAKRTGLAATVLLAVMATVTLTGPDARAAGTNAVVVGGTPILRIREEAGGLSKEQRAARVQDRLNRILSRGRVRAEDISVEGFGNEALVRVKGQFLITADWKTARANRTAPLPLADHWAARLRRSLPSLTASR